METPYLGNIDKYHMVLDMDTESDSCLATTPSSADLAENSPIPMAEHLGS